MNTSPQYKVLIADDEPEAIDLIAALLKPFKEFEVTHSTQDSNRAGEIITSGLIDLAFLDIEFPGTTAFNALHDIPANTNLVFVSAHEHYAIKAIRHSATDYLLKPVDPDEFEVVMGRVLASFAAQGRVKIRMEKSIGELQEQRIALPTQHGYQYISVKGICSITANGSYAELHDIDGIRHLVSRNLTDFERILESKGFIRIHRSYLINSEHIRSFSRLDGGLVEMKTNQRFPISRTFKETALKRITQFFEKV